MRTISDRADDSAHVDFSSFVEKVASQYARAIMEGFLTSLSIK
jgi:adenosylhomocysteine nucleosidase